MPMPVNKAPYAHTFPRLHGATMRWHNARHLHLHMHMHAPISQYITSVSSPPPASIMPTSVSRGADATSTVAARASALASRPLPAPPPSGHPELPSHPPPPQPDAIQDSSDCTVSDIPGSKNSTLVGKLFRRMTSTKQ